MHPRVKQTWSSAKPKCEHGCPKEASQLSANSRVTTVTTKRAMPLTSHTGRTHPRTFEKSTAAWKRWFEGYQASKVSYWSASTSGMQAAWLAYVRVRLRCIPRYCQLSELLNVPRDAHLEQWTECHDDRISEFLHRCIPSALQHCLPSRKCNDQA